MSEEKLRFFPNKSQAPPGLELGLDVRVSVVIK